MLSIHSLISRIFHAVLWKGRRLVDLGTLPGGDTSLGISVNNARQVVGFSNNGVPDPFAMLPNAKHKYEHFSGKVVSWRTLAPSVVLMLLQELAVTTSARE